MQITNATSIVGYPNVITLFALGRSPQVNSGLPRAFDADYETEAGLASETDRLLDHYDLLLTHGTLRSETRSRIAGAIEALEGESEEIRQLRARVASILVMTSPEYVVLR
jgi:hypothetical protein